MREPDPDRLPAAIEDALSMTPQERLLSDRLGSAIVKIQEILEFDGEILDVNGEPMLVGQTEHIAEDSLGNEHYVRPYRRSQKQVDRSTTYEYGILFDQTPDDENIDGATDTIRLRQLVGFLPEIVMTNAQGTVVKLNDEAVIEHTLATIDTLYSETYYARNAKKQDIEAAKYNRSRFVRRAAIWGSVALVAGAGVLGLTRFDWAEIMQSDEEDFDEAGYSLEGGAIIGIGESAHPEFSEELRTNSALNIDEMPLIAGGNTSYPDEELLTDKGSTSLREIVITGSKEDDECVAFDLDEYTLPLDAKMIIWSDFVDADGTPRTDELTVSLSTEKIEACWDGEERSPEDDPRVVIDIRDRD